ncbi:hypothetical protein G7Y79_00038g075010 [Physcia stellaris]|nr:hypothetical protein G7Y79_00038g075010 [Physcia stellaris]
MPAPLAKGLILSFSILFAASLAVYENNPEIREWVDNSRRKIAVALHNFGDEIAPPFPSRNPNPRRDASTREDESAEAAERRRKARQEIIERGRVLEERRRQKRANTRTFDDLVDKDGLLKSTHDTAARTTAAEPIPQPETSELKKRKTEAAGAAMGATLANPFADEVPMEFYSADESTTPIAHTRSSTPTLPATSPREQQAPTTPPAPNTFLIDTDDLSTHPSEQLVDLTPTSSPTVPSAFSPHHDDLASLSPISPSFSEADGDEAPPPAPWPVSINEWAENTSFYSAPQSQPDTQEQEQDTAGKAGTLTPTASESGEHVSQIGSEDMDVMSEIGGISTPGSWTEVGSDSGEEF